MHRVATGLLAAMVVLYVAASLIRPADPVATAVLAAIRAFAEAATVGACADWFAVTALFRRPFGLPIPHTAIIPRNKDRIGEGLGRFIEANFLAPDVVRQKLGSLDIAGRLADRLSDADQRRRLASRVADMVPVVIEGFGDAPFQRFVRAVAGDQLRALPAATLAGRALTAVLAGGHHQRLLDRLIDVLRPVLDNSAPLLKERIAERTSWWMPHFVDERIARALMTGMHDLLVELADPGHPWRRRADVLLAQLAEDLDRDPELAGRCEAIKLQIIDSPAVQGYLGELWAGARTRILADLATAEGETRVWIHTILATVADRLAGDAQLRSSVNRWITLMVLRQVVPYRREIGDFIAGVVRRWDTATLVTKLEERVGRDLQYIRINGALVGGLVGLAIHLLGRLGGL